MRSTNHRTLQKRNYKLQKAHLPHNFEARHHAHLRASKNQIPITTGTHTIDWPQTWNAYLLSRLRWNTTTLETLTRFHGCDEIPQPLKRLSALTVRKNIATLETLIATRNQISQLIAPSSIAKSPLKPPISRSKKLIDSDKQFKGWALCSNPKLR